jgi:hypothetical protein
MRLFALDTKRVLLFCLLLVLAGAYLAAQHPNSQPEKAQWIAGPAPPAPGVRGFTVLFENDQLVVNPPQPYPGAGDPDDELSQACPTLPTQDRARCEEKVDKFRAPAPHNWHNHKLNRVMIYFRTGGETLTYLDGTVEELKWDPGTVNWSPAIGFHYSGPLATPRVDPRPIGPSGVIIAIKKLGYPGKVEGTALDPLRVAPKNFTVIFENTQVRALRLNLGPRQSVPMHEYTLNHLAVCMTDLNVRMTPPAGEAEVAQRKLGDLRWSGPSQQRIDNLADSPLEMVILELKTLF